MTPRSSRSSGLYQAALVIFVALAMAAASGCTGSRDEVKRVDEIPDVGVVEDHGEAPHQGGHVTYGIAADPRSWNPATEIWDASGTQVARAVFDNLASFDTDSRAVPDLALAIDHDDTYTSWTIELRDGVKLHNGRAVDAAVVADDLEIYRSAPLTAPLLSAVTQITVTGELQVTIETTAPWVSLPEVLTGQVGMIADPEWLASGETAQPIGSGAFRFVSWTPGDTVHVERNPDWWRSDEHGLRLPYLDSIDFRVVPDENVRTAMIESGRLDIMATASGDKVTRFKIRDDMNSGRDSDDGSSGDDRSSSILGDGTFQVFTGSPGESPETFVQLNTATAPFVDGRVRELLAASTDPESFIESMERDLYEPATGPFSESSPWYHDTGKAPYDPDRARDLVEEIAGDTAAVTPDEPLVTFKLLIPTDTHLLDSARHLRERWAAFGIDAIIDMAPASEFELRVTTGDYQAAIRTGFDSPDPVLDIATWHRRASAPVGDPALNSARIVDAELSEEIDAVSATPDAEARSALYGSIQELLARDVPFVWLYHGIRGVVASKNLVNVINHSLPGGADGLGLVGGTHPLFQIWTKN